MAVETNRRSFLKKAFYVIAAGNAISFFGVGIYSELIKGETRFVRYLDKDQARNVRLVLHAPSKSKLDEYVLRRNLSAFDSLKDEFLKLGKLTHYKCVRQPRTHVTEMSFSDGASFQEFFKVFSLGVTTQNTAIREKLLIDLDMIVT